MTSINFSFGDLLEMADDLLALVIADKETATCGEPRDSLPASLDRLQVWWRDLAPAGRGRPAAGIVGGGSMSK